MERTSHGGGGVWTKWIPRDEEKWGETLMGFENCGPYPTPSRRTSPHLVGSHEIPGETWFLQITVEKLFLLITLVCKSHEMERTSRGGGGVWTKWIPRDEEKWGETLTGFENCGPYPTPSRRASPHLVGSHEIPGETGFLQITVEKLFLLITLVCKSHEMERTSHGGGGVWTNLTESHEMRRNGENFSWDWKLLKIPRDDEIPWDFSPINANAAPVS